MLANYIHDLNPIIIEFTDSIKLRWYGLAYLAAFVVGFWLLKRLGEKKLWVLPGNMAADFIASAAFFGVFIGGRLGHVLFYESFDWITEDPLMPLRVWEGGMASHGGIIGLMIFTFVYCRMKQVSWTGLGDGLCVVAPLGLMFGRIANFINGELYGRVTDVSWAMKFPNAFWNRRVEELADGQKTIHPLKEAENHADVYNALTQADPSLVNVISSVNYTDGFKGMGNQELLVEKLREDDSLREVAGEFLEPRHPSQLYEAFFEGALLFAVLWFLRVKFPNLKHGILTGLFFVLYAFGRIFCEYYREPETTDTLGLTRGQFLSTFMIVIGIGFIIWGAKTGSTAPKDRVEFDRRKKEEA